MQAGLGSAIERELTARNAELSPAERTSVYNRNMTQGGWVGNDLPEMAERFDARWGQHWLLNDML